MTTPLAAGLVEWAAFQDMAVVKPKRSIGSFVAQVTISESHLDTLEITEQPVEQGSVITDHAYKKPALVTIECGWSNSPPDGTGGFASAFASSVTSVVPTGASTGNQPNQARSIYQGLLQLQADRIPFDVLTGKRAYTNMLLEVLAVDTRVESENILRARLRCRQLIIVSTSVVTIPINTSAQRNAPATTPTTNLGSLQLLPGGNANLTSLSTTLGVTP